MRRTQSPWRTWVGPGLLALGLMICPAAARAQEEPVETDKSGRPLDGYLATGALAGLALFIVAKTARR